VAHETINGVPDDTNASIYLQKNYLKKQLVQSNATVLGRFQSTVALVLFLFPWRVRTWLFFFSLFYWTAAQTVMTLSHHREAASLSG